MNKAFARHWRARTGEHCDRPTDPAVAASFARQFPQVKLFTIDAVSGGWTHAQKTHFADGGSLDKVHTPRCAAAPGPAGPVATGSPGTARAAYRSSQCVVAYALPAG